MGFHVATDAPNSDNVEFQRAFFAPANAFVELTKLFPVFRSNELIDIFAYDSISVLGANHGKTGGIHVQQSAVPVNNLHAFRRCLNNGAITFFISNGRLRGLLSRSYVHHQAEHARFVAHPCAFAVKPPQPHLRLLIPVLKVHIPGFGPLFHTSLDLFPVSRKHS